MAVDATGAPTPLGIPKYNVNVDAPSGLGFNATMDVLDTLIAARVGKPAGIVSGEAPVWNGTTWVRSSVTQIGADSLTGLVKNTSAVVNGANTDLAWGNASAVVSVVRIATGGGTLRSLGPPTAGNATRVALYNDSAASVTIKQQLAGGSGSPFNMRTGVDLVLAVGDIAEFHWTGPGTPEWREVSRDVATTSSVIAPTHLPGMGSGSIDFPVVANTAYLMPIGNVVTATSISRLAWAMTAVVAGNYDIGIFYSDDEATFTLLGSKGSTALPAAGNIITTIAAQTITPVAGRRWYYGFAASTASTIVGASPTAVKAGGIPGYTKAASFPLATMAGMTAIGATPLVVVHGAV